MFDRRKPVGKVVALPVDQIEPSPYQARRTFNEEELAGLAASIRENGLLQPVTVRRLGPDRYELIAGERRLRACKLAGMEQVPAILRDYQDDQTAALSLLENIQRADLNPFEQARGLQDVLALWGCTQAEAAKRLGMAQPTLANKLRLLQLTADQQQFILENHLTERHARAVLRLPENRRSEALITISRRRMNARAADRYVEQLLQETDTPAQKDDRQRRSRHRPTGGRGRLHRIHRPDSHRPGHRQINPDKHPDSGPVPPPDKPRPGAGLSSESRNAGQGMGRTACAA